MSDATTTADGFRVGRRVMAKGFGVGEIVGGSSHTWVVRRPSGCEIAVSEYDLELLPEPDAPATPEPPADDPVNHPKHYTCHPSGVECIQIARHMGFNLGNAMKYIWRADLKGKAVEDLEKAVFYLNDEIEKRKKPATTT